MRKEIRAELIESLYNKEGAVGQICILLLQRGYVLKFDDLVHLYLDLEDTISKEENK